MAPFANSAGSVFQPRRPLPNANTILPAWEKSSSIKPILSYSPALIITIGIVGEVAPASFSTVMANRFCYRVRRQRRVDHGCAESAMQ
jgi:hypothetical protein